MPTKPVMQLNLQHQKLWLTLNFSSDFYIENAADIFVSGVSFLSIVSVRLFRFHVIDKRQ